MSGQLWPGLRFEPEEYARRLARLRTLLAEEGADAAIVADERTTWYLTGFGDVGPIGSLARPRIVVVPRDGPPTFLVHRSTARTVAEMLHDEYRLEPYAGLGAPVGRIGELLAEVEARSVGAELGAGQAPRFSFADLDALAAHLGGVLLDAAPLLARLRAVKSPAELERLRAACDLTTAAYEAGFGRVAAGMSEREVAATMSAALREQGADDAWSTCVLGRGDYGRVDGVGRSRPVERGELVFVDMGANVGGYWADFSRAGVIGAPTAKQREMQRLVHEATAVGVERCRPGTPASAVAAAVDAAMATRGLEFNTLADRYGHGIGMLVTEPPDIAAHDATPLAAGMVVTIEPGMHTEAGVFHCEEVVEIGADGPTVLSRSDWRLRELG